MKKAIAVFKVGFYWLSQVVVGALFRIIWGIRSIDAHNVPPAGPVIIACNHIAYLDPPAVGVACPRPIAYMAKHELFEIPLLGPLIRVLGAFPVDRSRGDVASMKTALGVLKSGGVLGIFPEGTRNKERRKIDPGLGLAMIAAKTGATVIPTFVAGTADARTFARFTVRFGEPLPIAGGRKASREDLAKWSDVLMERIYDLRETSGGH